MQTNPIVFWVPLAMQVPWILVCIAGIVVAISRWSRHPRVSLLTVSALGVMLLARVATTFYSALLPMLHRQGPFSAQELQQFVLLVNLGLSSLSSIALAALIVAVFGWRAQTSPVVHGTVAGIRL